MIQEGKTAEVDFTPNRSREGPIRILKSRKQGYLQTDRSAGYDRLYDGREVSLTHVDQLRFRAPQSGQDTRCEWAGDQGNLTGCVSFDLTFGSYWS